MRLVATEPAARGIVPALAIGLSAARGHYLARMDADDVMHDQRLTLQCGALEDDPTLFAVTCRAAAFPPQQLRDGMRAYLDWQNSLLTPAQIMRDRFIECPALHPTWMMRTAALRERLGGWRDAGWPEDWDLLLRAFEDGLRMRRLPETLLQWRLHPRQATRMDARYSEDSLLRARAHFLARHLRGVTGARPLWILGAGPVGKGLVKALAEEGVLAAGLVDVDVRKIGGIVRGGGRSWPVIAHDALRDLAPRPFAISAVSGAPARARIRGELARWGWREGDDFVAAA